MGVSHNVTIAPYISPKGKKGGGLVAARENIICYLEKLYNILQTTSDLSMPKYQFCFQSFIISHATRDYISPRLDEFHVKGADDL